MPTGGRHSFHSVFNGEITCMVQPSQQVLMAE